MRTARSSSHRGQGGGVGWSWSPWISPLGVGLDLIPLNFPLGVGLDLIPLNFPLGCGPGPDPLNFPLGCGPGGGVFLAGGVSLAGGSPWQRGVSQHALRQTPPPRAGGNYSWIRHLDALEFIFSYRYGVCSLWFGADPDSERGWKGAGDQVEGLGETCKFSPFFFFFLKKNWRTLVLFVGPLFVFLFVKLKKYKFGAPTWNPGSATRFLAELL